MINDRLWQMEVYCAVVDAGGFMAAAQRLGVSQSAVSKTLRALEDRLGAVLLNRNTRGHVVSLEGKQYLANCRKVLELVESVEDDLTSEKLDASGQLKISVPMSFGLDQISPIIPIFMEKNPDLSIELSVTDRVENIIDGQIDIAIRMGELKDSTLIGRRLCSLDRIVVASPEYLKKNGIPKSPSELCNHNCLMWKGNANHLNTWPFNNKGSRSTVRIGGNFQSNNGMALIAACLEGVGIMRIAEHVAVPLLKTGKLVQLLVSYHLPDDQAFYIVFQREKQNLTRVRNFIEFCIQEFRTPNWTPGEMA